MAAHGGVVVEPWLDRVLDFSSLYEIKADGRIDHLAFTVMENDAAGRFLGIRVARKWGNLLPDSVAEFLFREAKVLGLYTETIPSLLAKLLPGYSGPVGVDAMVHRRRDGSLALKPVVELNVRFTMGRLAWHWLKQSGQSSGRLRLLRKADLSPEDLADLKKDSGMRRVALNDPEQAEHFVACWSLPKNQSPPESSNG